MQNQGIGVKIAALRKSKNYTQSDLGVYLNISYQAVSKWERGEACPDFDTLSHIAKLFNVPINYFEEETPVEALVTYAEAAAAVAVAEKPVDTAPEKEMLGVCKECGKVVYEGDEGKLVPYIYCKKCNEKLIRIAKEKEEAKKREEKKAREQALIAEEIRKEEIRRSRNKGLIWAAVIVGALLIFDMFRIFKSENFWADFGFELLGAVFLYTFVAQLFWGGFVVDAVMFGGKVIGTPGIIFEFSLDGFIFLIVMKILFALLRFVIWALSWLVCAIFAILVSPFTFVPALLRVNSGDLV